jgi:tRNA-specific 2-thiouridylase
MDEAEKKVGRGYSLVSGGLDSQLAVCVLKEQGLHIEGVVFESPFFKSDAARKAAAQLGIQLHVVDFTKDILELIKEPPHGFGNAMNPCIDCHSMMIRRAGEMMRANGFDFVSTGEVLGQRPMSQNRQSLGTVERGADMGGRLLRPLSAQLLEPTLPEKEGIVDRSRLLGLNGRSRKPQLELAAKYGIKEFPSPAGGCMLTEKGFGHRLADVRDHGGLGDVRLVQLLLHGRHFRLPGGAKCIVGRNASDNKSLKQMAVEGDAVLCTVDVPGPTVLLPGGASDEDLALAVGMCAQYGDHTNRPQVTVRVIRGGKAEERMVTPIPKEQFGAYLL